MFRMANVEGNRGSIGTRIPVVLIQKLTSDIRVLHLFMAISGDPNWTFRVDFKENKWYTLKINQKRDSIGKYIFKAYLDDQLFANKINDDAQLFENVKVFSSDHYHFYAFDGLIRNFKVCTEGMLDKISIDIISLSNYTHFRFENVKLYIHLFVYLQKELVTQTNQSI